MVDTDDIDTLPAFKDKLLENLKSRTDCRNFDDYIIFIAIMEKNGLLDKILDLKPKSIDNIRALGFNIKIIGKHDYLKLLDNSSFIDELYDLENNSEFRAVIALNRILNPALYTVKIDCDYYPKHLLFYIFDLFKLSDRSIESKSEIILQIASCPRIAKEIVIACEKVAKDTSTPLTQSHLLDIFKEVNQHEGYTKILEIQKSKINGSLQQTSRSDIIMTEHGCSSSKYLPKLR